MSKETLSGQVDEIIKTHKDLSARRDKIVENKNRIEAELKVARRELEKAMNEAREEGFDPNNLEEDLKREVEIITIKLNTVKTDIEIGEKIIEPILKNIEADN